MIAAKYISLLALPILAAATPTTNNSPSTTVSVTATSTATQPASQCDTGAIQCCDSVQSSSSESAAGLLGILGVVLQGLNVPVGLTCSPISVVGVGGDSCSAAPVCCENNNFNGLIALGCVPVDLSL